MKVAVKTVSRVTFVKSAKYKATNKQFNKITKNYEKYNNNNEQPNINYLEAQVLQAVIKSYTKLLNLFKNYLS